ncbi:MAG: hypothetical protein M1833_001977 [Piccolia ochrophora]|nr:MAG: hypothetical protein M1833_001977 [Piccolia ochrophora]
MSPSTGRNLDSVLPMSGTAPHIFRKRPAFVRVISRQASKPAITSALRALMVFGVVFGLAVLYGYTHFYRDPGSVFFDPKHAFVRWYSEYREQEAKQYIDEAAKSPDELAKSPGHPKTGSNPAICATFTTVIRDAKEPYIETSIGSTLQGLSIAERSDLNLSLLFASLDPAQHPTYHKAWVRDVVDHAYGYNDVLNAEDIAQLSSFEAQGAWQSKSSFDYRLALRQCYDHSSSPYIAIFEGDIILADGWMVRTLKALRDLETQMKADTKKADGDWLFLRLFNQERSTSWASRSLGANYEAPLSILLACIAYAVLKLVRGRSNLVRKQLDASAIMVICLVAIPSFVILFFQSGKASLLPPKAGVREELFGCCSQGLVFNRERIPALIDFLHTYEAIQYDLATKAYAKMNNYSMFSLYPVQIQHIGSRSSRPANHDEAKAVWSMAFESLEPAQLRSEHQKMLLDLYDTPR